MCQKQLAEEKHPSTNWGHLIIQLEAYTTY